MKNQQLFIHHREGNQNFPKMIPTMTNIFQYNRVTVLAHHTILNRKLVRKIFAWSKYKSNIKMQSGIYVCEFNSFRYNESSEPYLLQRYAHMA